MDRDTAFARLRKDADDLSHDNQHRQTRVSSFETRRSFVPHCIQCLSQILTRINKEANRSSLVEDDELDLGLMALKKAVQAIEAIDCPHPHDVSKCWRLLRRCLCCCCPCAQRRQRGGAAANYPGINVSTQLDHVFSELLQNLSQIGIRSGPENEAVWAATFGQASIDEECQITRPIPDVQEGFSVKVLTLGGSNLTVSVLAEMKLLELKQKLHKLGGPKVKDQKLCCLELSDTLHIQDNTTLQDLGINKDSLITLICVPWCELCRGPCQCASCHGEGRFSPGCEKCNKERAECNRCGGPCLWAPFCH